MGGAFLVNLFLHSVSFPILFPSQLITHNRHINSHFLLSKIKIPLRASPPKLQLRRTQKTKSTTVMSATTNLKQPAMTEPSVFEQIQTNDHEQVVFCYDKASGLKSIIAIHNTVIGPALGGTRFWNYRNDQEALTDVLRLSRGMTYKAAITGLNLGGGKAIIIGNSATDKSEALYRRYGKFVESLNGKYITAEDVGTSKEDMEWIAQETKHVTGVPEYMGGSGDPSPFTAYGTFLGIKASCKEVFGNDSLQGKKVAVQGVGHVGYYLVKHLCEAGANVFVCDIVEANLKAVTKDFKVTVVGVDEIYDLDAQVYAPCALGATINDDTVERFKFSVIAGAANNQLKDETKHGQALVNKGICYAPDFLINAGGLINVSAELEGYNRERVMGQTEKIYNRVLEIFAAAKTDNLTPQQAAIKLAEKRIKDVAALKSRL